MIFCGPFEPSRRFYKMAAPIKPLAAPLLCNIGHVVTVVSLSARSSEVWVGNKLTRTLGVIRWAFLALMPFDG